MPLALTYTSPRAGQVRFHGDTGVEDRPAIREDAASFGFGRIVAANGVVEFDDAG